MSIRTPRTKRAFTLVELLVVIAIIGVLVALLLPAIQAAREAARRASCKNNLKNIALSVLNHENSLGTFPTGGSHWGIHIEDYVEDGRALGTSKQGLGWMYQILPYLEQGALSNLITTEELSAHAVDIYNCPSRRSGAVRDQEWEDENLEYQVYLSDYSGVQPCTGYPEDPFSTPVSYTPSGGAEELQAYIEDLNRNAGWTEARTMFYQYGNSDKANSKVGPTPQANCRYDGAIVRSPWRRAVAQSTRKPGIEGDFASGVSRPVKMSKISDGASNTLMVGEKWVRVDLYETGSSSDDTGWTDGWDPDAMRLSCVRPMNDGTNGAIGSDGKPLFADAVGVQHGTNVWENFMFGSAHPGSFHMAFCDGSVQSFSYDVDLYAFNALGTRNGEENVNLGDLEN